MQGFVKFVRRLLIRMQLRSLDQQAEHIIDARNWALARLIQIRRERDHKEAELSLYEPRPMRHPSAF